MACISPMPAYSLTLICSELCTTGKARLSLGEDDEELYNGLDYVDETYYYDKDKLTRGRVELCVNGSFRGICRDSWDFNHATVVCKELGFSEYGKYIGIVFCHMLGIFIFLFHILGAIPVTTGQFSSASLLLSSTTINCNGSEASLLECVSQVEEEDCIRDDAGVVCQGKLI